MKDNDNNDININNIYNKKKTINLNNNINIISSNNNNKNDDKIEINKKLFSNLIKISKYYNYFPEFTDIIFNIKISKLFKKDNVQLILKKNDINLIINNRSDLNIYIYLNNINILNLNNIKNILSNSFSKEIQIENNVSKKYIFIFKNLYEKYLFQSLLDNYYLFNIQSEYIENNLKLNISILTWNVASIDTPNLNILFESKEQLDKIDLLVFGFQEIKLLLINEWIESLNKIANSFGFVEITETTLFQMVCIIFIKKKFKPLVTNIETNKKGMGFAGIIGNKGGVIISFKILNFNFIFINCHLAPKVFKVLERNLMAQNLNNIKVGDKIISNDVYSDYLFWFGDMNYRIDFEFKMTIDYLNKNDIKTLLEKDQLKKSIKFGKIFCDFYEENINFLPTYRLKKIKKDKNGNEYILNEPEYDDKDNNKNNNNENIEDNNLKNIKNLGKYGNLYSNKKKQSPSWCDRILLKTDRDFEIKKYEALEEIKYSDHKPVRANYSIYLTLPIFNNINDMIKMENNIKGELLYKNLKILYHLSESDIKLKFPLQFKMYIYFISIEENPKEIFSEVYEHISFINEKNEYIEIKFNDFYINIPPKIIFNNIQLKAFNIFFVFKILMKNIETEFGFSKYSFENIEKKSNLLDYKLNLPLYFSLRKMGNFSFEAVYKYNEI